jgi:acetolactate synthase-1/2/3 large subunit
MSEITVGELLLRCLRAEGIDAMFGIVDGSHVPFVGLTPRYGITYVNAHHEEAAVHMAEGYTRITRKVSAVIGNPGPGGANMIAGLTSAQGEGHPILAITCTRRTATTQPDRGGAWQATDLYEMAKPVTKYTGYVSRADRLPEMVRAALRAATIGHPGPALLVIPDELLTQKIDAEKVMITPAEKHRVQSMGSGDTADIAQAAAWLADAEKVFIHAGKGVLWADGSAELIALGDYLGAALGSSTGARGVVPEDHPHYFSNLDIPAVNQARNEADVVLVVGSRLGEYDGWGMPPVWGDPAKQKTIHIDADPFSIGLNRPVDLAIVADAKKALTALLEAVQAKTAPRTEMPGLERYRESSARTLELMSAFAQAPTSHGVHPAQMVSVLREALPKDTITVLDGGNIVLVSMAYFPILAPTSYIYSVKMGYLGTGLPFAIGAQVADRSRPVCLITGDGALGFCIMELETALRHHAPVLVIAAVDQSWGMEKSAFTSRGFSEDEYVDIGISPETRYDLIAQGMGCFGALVEDIEQLPDAIRRATESGKPALIHVAIDPDLNANPPGRDLFKYVRSL